VLALHRRGGPFVTGTICVGTVLVRIEIECRSPASHLDEPRITLTSINPTFLAVHI
jgi:hypothetical protein